MGSMEEKLSLLEGGEVPSLANFVDYVEHGNHGPAKKEREESKKARLKLVKATMICFVFMIIEIVGGYFAGSLAIMTDAAHLLSDVAGFCVSLFALYLGERKATSTLTYGFKRAEIIGAILSVMLIWFLTGILIWEAILRTQGIVNDTRDSVVDGKIMFIVAGFGLVANMTLLFVLGHDHSHGGGGHGHSHGGGNDHGHSHGGEESYQSKGSAKPKKKAEGNINVSAAYVHAIGDLIQSAGVCVAGGLIWAFPGKEHRMVQLADPFATFMFSILVLYSTYEILSTSMNVLMEGVPDGVNPREIASSLASIPDVTSVHHLHIWAITIGSPSLSVHLVVKRGADMEAILRRAQHILREHHIDHTTIQCESGDKEVCSNGDCEGTPCTSYAIKCHDNGNCFDEFHIENSTGARSYGTAVKSSNKSKSSHGHSHSKDSSHGHSHGKDTHGHSHSKDNAHGHSHGKDNAHGHSHGKDSNHGHSHQ